MITTLIFGRWAYHDEKARAWRWRDNDEVVDDDHLRPCPRCGRLPTEEGYDPCIGYIPGASSACCGHGMGDPYVVMGDELLVGDEAQALIDKYRRENDDDCSAV